MPKTYLWIFILLFSCIELPESEETNRLPVEKPNVILIMADDLGYGDLSIYGQSRFETPNIDKLGRSGMLFTQHYSGSTVCAPSRSALMTGLHTGHTPIRGNREIQPEGQHPINDQVYTIAEMLKSNGYATGAFGKWGLGYPGSSGDPMNQGFDRFFGYNCQRLGHSYYPNHLWSDTTKLMLTDNQDSLESVYAPELIHEELLAFIRANRENSFFAFVPSIIPHAELKAPERYMEKYRGQFDPEKSYEGCDPGCKNYRIGGYASQNESHAAFAAMISLLDDQVGEIVETVEELGLSENTVIIFTSDNGPHLEGGADPDYFDSNGELRGYKRDLYEGGIRVPLLVSWPGMVQSDSRSDHVSANWDFFATISHLVSGSMQSSGDGISFLPELLGVEQSAHDFMYWEFPSKWAKQAQAVLMDGRWKAIRFSPDSIELYDLKTDIGEQTNIAGLHPEVVERARELFTSQHEEPEVADWSLGW